MIPELLIARSKNPEGARRVTVLGSTGSIGRAALDVIGQNRERFELLALGARNNAELLADQARKYAPRYVAMADPERGVQLRDLLRQSAGAAGQVEVLYGSSALEDLARDAQADIVLAAISGSAGLAPVLAAVSAGKQVALANKESLVVAGKLLQAEQQRSKALIVPVDSEHSGIFQALEGRPRCELAGVTLTASGGPFLDMPEAALKHVTPQQALAHPRWKMGPKVSIDSATMANKALEVIEAYWLFGVGVDRIKVLVHPQSIVHALVSFCDGAQLAQLSVPDMRAAISFALAYPGLRLAAVVEPLDLAKAALLEFRELDSAKFPAVEMARQCLERGGTAPAVFNYANELGVDYFLTGRIGFAQIVEGVRRIVESWPVEDYSSLPELYDIRRRVHELFSKLW